jgi:hypothetical protein
MRERVAMYGGRLDAGDGPDGGFVVRAVLPLDPDATALTTGTAVTGPAAMRPVAPATVPEVSA